MLFYIGKIFPDSVPLYSDLVEIFGSTVEAGLVLIFLLCRFTVNAPVLGSGLRMYILFAAM